MSLTKDLSLLYWSLGDYGIDDERRMKAVLHEVAGLIRAWAPDKGQARICHLAINEVADRLIQEINE